MLAIGRGLMSRPRLLILDEPSLGLSPLLVEEMFALIGRLHADGLAILLVEQNVMQSLRDRDARACHRKRPLRAIGKRRGTRRQSRTRKSLSGNVSMTDDHDHSRAESVISLKARLARGGIVVAPGVYDALTASLAARRASRRSISPARRSPTPSWGGPTSASSRRPKSPKRWPMSANASRRRVIVDADTGYGNALNVQRTVRLFERAGAAAIQLEDQTFPSAAGISPTRGVDRRARNGRQDPRGGRRARAATRRSIIARTDAVAVEGFEAAIERAHRYAEAGADMLFVEAPRTREQLARGRSARSAIGRR